MYKNYVDRIASTLQKTLSLHADSSAISREVPPMPSVATLSEDAPLSYADGQMLLLLPDVEGRLAGGQGNPQIGQVQGQIVQHIGAAGSSSVSFDGCSQEVVPWKALDSKQETSFLRDVEALSSNSAQWQKLHEVLKAHTPERLDETSVETVLESVGSLLGDQQAAASAEARKTALQALMIDAEKALRDATSQQPDLTDVLSRAAWLSSVRDAVALRLHCELVTRALQSMGAVGMRRYASSQLLTVRHKDAWVDTIVADGAVVVNGKAVPLHPWNHAPRELPQDDFRALREWWREALRVQHSHISDALSGRQLDVLQQCVAISMGAATYGRATPNATPRLKQGGTPAATPR